MLGAIAGAFGSLNDFSIDIRRTLERILKRSGTAVTGVEGWMAQQRVRITELEERFRALEQKNAELAQEAQGHSQRIRELEAARAMETACQSGGSPAGFSDIALA
jgi:TolA-binding protein